jgi:hypothetical protein
MPAKQPPMKHGSSNDFQTPPLVLDYLIPYIPAFISKIWECASGKGFLSNKFIEIGYNVISTDILTGTDFLTCTPPEYDMIVTNPPYTIKGEFLERCYELGKPFALLLPFATLETPKRQGLFRKNGLQIIFLPKRVNFFTPSGKGTGSWFATAWFTNGLNLEKDMIFCE